MSTFLDRVPCNATNKNSGEVAQSIFYAEVMKRGLTPLVTFGDNLPFDMVVYEEAGGRFVRVQIKSTHGRTRGRLKWTCGLGGKKRGYLPGEVDVFALHDFSSGDWYLVPTAELNGKISVSVGPKQKALTKWREAWSVFA